jgi:hypothetical protein
MLVITRALLDRQQKAVFSNKEEKAADINCILSYELGSAIGGIAPSHRKIQYERLMVYIVQQGIHRTLLGYATINASIDRKSHWLCLFAMFVTVDRSSAQ